MIPFEQTSVQKWTTLKERERAERDFDETKHTTPRNREN